MWGVMTRHGFWVCVRFDLDLGDMTWSQDHDTPLGSGQQVCEILFRPNFTVKKYGPDMDFRYVSTVGSRSWHTLGSRTTSVWNIIQIKVGNEELRPGHRCLVNEHCDLDLGDMALGQGHDTPLGYGQQVCEMLSGSTVVERSYDADTDFRYMCTVTLEILPWVKVMTHPWFMDNKCVKYYLDPTWQWGVMARHGFWVCVRFDLDLGDMTLSQDHDTPLGSGQQVCEILFRSNFTVWKYGPDMDFRYVSTIGSRSWRTLGSRTTSVWNIIQIKVGSEELWPGHRFLVNEHCDLDLGDTRYDLRSRSWHTLGLWTTSVWNNIQIQLGSEELWSRHRFWVCEHCLVKVVTHPWVIDNKCVKFYQDPIWQWGLIAQTRIVWYLRTVTLSLVIWPWMKVMTHPWVMDNNCVK